MIWAVLGCYLGAALIVLTAPLLLTVGRWQLLHPRLALTAWFGAFFAGFALVLIGLAVSAYGALQPAGTLSTLESVLLTVTAWSGLALVGAASAAIFVSAEPLVAHQKAAAAQFNPVALSRELRAGFTLVSFKDASPVAFAYSGGARPQIFVSDSLEQVLSKDEVTAVLAHEYAHLHQRHGLAMRIAAINSMCLDGLRPGRSLQRAVTLLVELAADDAAARQAGAANLANALETLATITNNPAMQMRANRLAGKPWPKSAHRKLPPGLKRI